MHACEISALTMELCRETVVFCLFDVRRHAVPFDPAVHMAINTTDIVCALESLKYVTHLSIDT